MHSSSHTPQGVIKKIVVTGGPCGGKTSGMTYAKQKFATLGRNVLVVPEAATQLINAGHIPGKTMTIEAFQDLVIKKQLENEKKAYAKAEYSMKMSDTGAKNQLILHDRGLLDGGAYVDEADFIKTLRANRLDRDEILKGDFYDGVICLKSTADGAPEAYKKNRDNNPARGESVEQALAKCLRTREQRVGAKKLHIIGNDTNFLQKKKRTYHKMLATTGLPQPLEIEDKFAVKSIDRDALNQLRVPLSHITQAYITAPQGEQGIPRVRKLVQGLFTGYIHTIKGPGEFEEREHDLTKQQYDNHLQNIIPHTHQLYKQRRYFLWNDQYFELDDFEYPDNVLPEGDVALLELEKTSVNQKVQIPDFMEVEEVTNDPRYSNAVMAGVKKYEMME